MKKSTKEILFDSLDFGQKKSLPAQVSEILEIDIDEITGFNLTNEKMLCCVLDVLINGGGDFVYYSEKYKYHPRVFISELSSFSFKVAKDIKLQKAVLKLNEHFKIKL
tara:strand:+ start:7277 stop:7600 length:324 start_codon:yes stop_codon:yes gene_type:complete